MPKSPDELAEAKRIIARFIKLPPKPAFRDENWQEKARHNQE